MNGPKSRTSWDIFGSSKNPFDRVAFLRIVNTPTRGIGKSSLDRFVQWSDEAGIDLLSAARQSERVPNLSKKAAVGLRAFAALIEEFSDLAANPFGNQFGSTEFDFQDAAESSNETESARGPVETVLRAVLERTGYYRQYEGALDEDEIQRKSNVDELISSAMLFDRHMTEQEDVATLGSFLETASLTQDVDSLEEETGAVTLMTLHAAKGLEFPDVYLVGVEQNLIPHERSLRENDKQPLEEERRLLFVGITRAKERLVLTHTQRREMHGRTLSTITSDFLQELIVERRDCTGASVSVEMWDEDYANQIGFEDSNPPATRSSDWSTAAHGAPKKPKKPSRKPHLTTGSALEAGANTFAEIPVGFGLGTQVRHPRYGLGTVVEVNGFSRMRTVTVEFAADNRRESFIAAKCPLQPVGFH